MLGLDLRSEDGQLEGRGDIAMFGLVGRERIPQHRHRCEQAMFWFCVSWVLRIVLGNKIIYITLVGVLFFGFEVGYLLFERL